jgi:hypothetical protein
MRHTAIVEIRAVPPPRYVVQNVIVVRSPTTHAFGIVPVPDASAGSATSPPG